MRMYTMNAPACYATSPTIQVPLKYYDTLSPSVYGCDTDSYTTILVPAHEYESQYDTAEPRIVPVTLVRYVPVTKIVTLPPILVIAVRQPIVAETRIYTSQTVEC